MSEREQYGKLADELEDRADSLAEENRRLGDRISGVREEWRHTREQSGAGTPDWDDPEDDEDDEDDEAGKDEDDDEEDEDD